jgi:hypothetical protein
MAQPVMPGHIAKLHSFGDMPQTAQQVIKILSGVNA